MAEAEDPKSPGGHTLKDHLYGENIVHEHDEYSDHDHDHFEFDDDGPLEQNPIWQQDHVTLVSVGIDIGSAGTQVIFSRINLRRYGEDLTSRYYVVSRETLYQSPVALTPYQSEERIDDAGLGRIIDDLNPILRGWFGYFQHATPGVFRAIDGLVRRRLRAISTTPANRAVPTCFAPSGPMRRRR